MTLLHPLKRFETSRERWIRRTRESVARQMVREGVPVSAQALEDNLDITRYMPGLGFVDRRTRGEISAALMWLTKNEYAKVTLERQKEDPPGKLYKLTTKGWDMAKESLVYDEPYVQRRGW